MKADMAHSHSHSPSPCNDNAKRLMLAFGVRPPRAARMGQSLGAALLASAAAWASHAWLPYPGGGEAGLPISHIIVYTGLIVGVALAVVPVLKGRFAVSREVLLYGLG